MAAPTVSRTGQVLGLLFAGSPSAVTSALSAAANWFAVSFVADSARTISTVRAYVSAVSGTLGGSDVLADLYDSTGTGALPGSSIETGKTPSATITASGWYTFTGFTTALTAGQTYWVVFRNVNGTPASNFPTFQVGSSLQTAPLAGATARFFWGQATSTNSGSTWSGGFTRSGYRLGYADGTFDGFPSQGSGGAGAAGDGVYSTRESGVKFTSPANATLNVAGIAMYVGGKTGTPTGSPRFGLWTGTSPVNQGYTNSIPTTGVTLAQWAYAYFGSTIQIPAATVARVTLAETAQSDTSANRWNNYFLPWDTDSNSLALLPFQGTAVKTYFDGSSWTDTSGSVPGFGLLLDPAGEFASAGSSGGFIIGG